MRVLGFSIRVLRPRANGLYGEGLGMFGDWFLLGPHSNSCQYIG